ncbi:Ig-like domain-containing protein [Parabacteroides sp. OttesenSCG-928-N08]|nr:Ig-like domain-containing protein [Parabacteroides sp. OttesenSCG-928-N08]
MRTMFTQRIILTVLCLLVSMNAFSEDGKTVTIHVEEAGTLHSIIGDDKYMISDLTITGYLNDDDFSYLRDISKTGGGGKLSVLNIKEIFNEGIPEFAFFSCDKLTSISLPTTLTSIGYGAFTFCTSLTSIEIPNGVTSLTYTFEGCTSLVKVSIPDGVSSLTATFEGCTNLANIVIPNGVTTLDAAFRRCSSLTSIIIPDGVTSLYDTFVGCTSLKSVIIPGSVTDVRYTFAGCTSLINVVIPDGVTSLQSTFSGCTSLESVIIPRGVTDVRDTFAGCISLINVVIPDGVTSLWGTFSGCTSLTSFNVPKDVTSLHSTFVGCTSLTSVTFPDGISYFHETFKDCTSLTNITLPNTIGNIGADAFNGCNSLTSITLPNRLSVIEENVFKGCRSLASITLPKTLTSIGTNAFSSCDNLVEIISENHVPPVCRSSTSFSSNTKNNGTLYVPVGTSDAYNSELVWEDFKNIVESGEVGVIAVSGVSLDSQLTLKEGDSEQLTANIQPENASNRAVSWKSSNSSVATVDNSGKVTGVSVGTATITVTTEDGNHTATCTVTVTARAVEGVSFNKTELSLLVGATEKLTITIFPENATNKEVTWSSLNSSIASVDQTGKITAVKEGQTVISVTTIDGNHKAYCEVTITDPVVKVSGISLDKDQAELFIGNSFQLRASMQPENATNQVVNWQSSSPSIATVENTGKVTGVAVGVATITVTTEDGNHTATCSVTVNQATVSVTGVSINKTSTSLMIGETEVLKATILPSDATNQAVSWKSNSPSIATVENTGKVTGVAVGVATITVTTEDGNHTATCSVTVNQATVSVTEVSINKTSTSLLIGETEVLKATILPSDATNKEVVWSSSNSSVAKVFQTGKITAVGEGKTTITATTVDGNYKAYCEVTVTSQVDYVSGVSLDVEYAELLIGHSIQLNATVEPANASDKSVTWTTSNSNVAIVDSKGKVLALGEGNTVVTVTSTVNKHTAYCYVTVEKRKEPEITITQTADELIVTVSGFDDASGYMVNIYKDANKTEILFQYLFDVNGNLRSNDVTLTIDDIPSFDEYYVECVAYKDEDGNRIILSSTTVDSSDITSSELLGQEYCRIYSVDGGVLIESNRQIPVSIYTINGQLVKQVTVSGSKQIALPDGTYIVNADGKSQKVIVQ